MNGRSAVWTKIEIPPRMTRSGKLVPLLPTMYYNQNASIVMPFKMKIGPKLATKLLVVGCAISRPIENLLIFARHVGALARFHLKMEQTNMHLLTEATAHSVLRNPNNLARIGFCQSA
jgi:hypothetical protein